MRQLLSQDYYPSGIGGADMEINKNTSLFKLAWPIFCQALLSMCIGYVDSLMLGRYSDIAVGAIGNANQIIGFLTLAFTIISSATGVVVAQYLGAKLQDKISQLYTVAIAFNLVLSGIISLIILFGSNFIMRIMNVPDEMLTDAGNYFRIVGGFVFVEALFNTFSQIFRSNGMTKIGMVVTLLINVLNICGNYLFLYGPLSFLNLGVTGVAISSAFSKVVALIVAIIFFNKKVQGAISIRYLRPFPYDILKKLVRLGIPTAGENISYNISQLVIQSFINTLGTVAITTKIYCGIMTNFSYLYSISVAVATSIIVGHEVGAGKYDDAYKRVIRTLGPAMVITEIIAIANLLLSGFTFSIITNDADILSLAQKVMIVAVVLELGRTPNLVVINSMRAAGDVKFPTLLGMGSMWGISVVFSYIFGIVLGFGLVGIWISMAMDEIFRGIVVYIRWRRGTWRGKSVVSDEMFGD